MADSQADFVAVITGEVSTKFRTFGGGRGSEFNPIASALKDQPPSFAAGESVEDVVRFVLVRLGYHLAETSREK